jgi:hypothetical protein
MATEAMHYDYRRLARATPFWNEKIADECDIAGLERNPFLHRVPCLGSFVARSILRRFDTAACQNIYRYTNFLVC